MKPSLPVFLFFFCTLLSPLPIQAMVNGSTIDSNKYPDLSAAIYVEYYNFRGGGIGTATHIGEGLLLTASHVVLPYDSSDNATVSFLDKSRLPLIPELKPIQMHQGILQPNDQNAFFSRPISTETITDSKGAQVPIPDLAVVIFPQNIREKIASTLPRIELKFTSISAKSLLTTLIVGRGLNSDNDSSSMQIGHLPLENTGNKLGYESKWRAGDTFASPRPGDSGGPVLIANSKKKLEMIGVTSTISRTLEGAVQGFVVPLHSPEVEEWIRSLLEKYKLTSKKKRNP